MDTLSTPFSRCIFVAFPVEPWTRNVTTQRKRSACGQLRTLALELGLEEGNAHLDMTIQQFDSLANDLEMRCTTPQQHGKLRQVAAHFHNALQCPPYLAQHRRLLHANQKTEKRQRLDGSSGCGPKALCSVTIQATLGSTCGQTS